MKQEYFIDFYKWHGEDMQVKVKALWDKNGKELYNGAKAIMCTPWGVEQGKIVVSCFVVDYNVHEYTYAFKPKKGFQLYIDTGKEVELV